MLLIAYVSIILAIYIAYKQTKYEQAMTKPERKMVVSLEASK